MMSINSVFTVSPIVGSIENVDWKKSPRPSKKFLNIA